MRSQLGLVDFYKYEIDISDVTRISIIPSYEENVE